MTLFVRQWPSRGHSDLFLQLHLLISSLLVRLGFARIALLWFVILASKLGMHE